MANYTIIGGDGKQYGPVSGEDLIKWISEGRLNAQSLAKAESDAEFRPLSTFPELAEAFPAQAVGADAPPSLESSADWLERDYELDIGGCISNGWGLLKTNFGLLFGSFIIYLLIEMGIGVLGNIPHVGFIFSIANMFVSPALMGGLYYVYIQAIRRQPAAVGDVFIGFRRAFWQLFLGYLIPALLVGLCMVPFVIAMVIVLMRMAMSLRGQTPEEVFHTLLGASQLPLLALIFLICFIPVIYLQIRWAFALPLIIDKGMDFWTAMKTSWKMHC